MDFRFPSFCWLWHPSRHRKLVNSFWRWKLSLLPESQARFSILYLTSLSCNHEFHLKPQVRLLSIFKSPLIWLVLRTLKTYNALDLGVFSSSLMQTSMLLEMFYSCAVLRCVSFPSFCVPRTIFTVANIPTITVQSWPKFQVRQTALSNSSV